MASQVFSFYTPIYETEISAIVNDEEYLEPYQTGYLIKMMDITETKNEDVKGLEGGQIAIELVKRLGEKFKTISKRLEEIYKEIADISS